METMDSDRDVVEGRGTGRDQRPTGRNSLEGRAKHWKAQQRSLVGEYPRWDARGCRNVKGAHGIDEQRVGRLVNESPPEPAISDISRPPSIIIWFTPTTPNQSFIPEGLCQRQGGGLAPC